MPIEPLPETTPQDAPVGPSEAADPEFDSGSTDSAERPVELSEFSQRLASFGLGEAPDPLLTEARPPVKRRSRS
jgi:hypothetical protein